MTNPFKKPEWRPLLPEIHEYCLDLQRITLLRDKCAIDAERDQYTTCIDVMQRVLIFLNTKTDEYL